MKIKSVKTCLLSGLAGRQVLMRQSLPRKIAGGVFLRIFHIEFDGQIGIGLPFFVFVQVLNG